MKGERIFLHDLVGPISTARTLLDVWIDEAQTKGQQDELIARLEKILKSVEGIADRVAARREELSQAEEPRE